MKFQLPAKRLKTILESYLGNKSSRLSLCNITRTFV